MITRLQTRNFRSLKGVDQRLDRFHALVGPNASGKTTFLDVVAFFSDLMRNRGDVVETVMSRSRTFEQLLWKREGDSFQLAIEVALPEYVRARLSEEKRHCTHVRYAVEIRFNYSFNVIDIAREQLWLLIPAEAKESTLYEFPAVHADNSTIFQPSGTAIQLAGITASEEVGEYFVEGRSLPNAASFLFSRQKGYAMLSSLPLNTEQLPVSSWLRKYLEQGIQPVTLNSHVLRQPGAPGQGIQFQPDGSNLPWVIADLRRDTKRFQNWLDHVRTALEDIHDIDTVERPEDRHRYLVIEYANGAKVPSWLVSDGTLRLLALTIPAYLPDLEGIFLIEEPENGIHPAAIETVMQSLSSMYDSQVLVATHSPIALSMLELHEVLCFAKNDEGATDIVSGDRHPVLREWRKGEPSLGVLFASGILS
jgi:predicted ATPase